MEKRIVDFIAALRTAGVRVSLAESADAFNAVDRLGVKNRESFRLALRATLVKEAGDIPLFEELFPLFFGLADSPPLMDLSTDLSPEEADMLARAIKQFSERLRQLLERLLRGEQLSESELKRIAKFVGLTQVDDLRFRRWMEGRLQKALRFPQVREAIRELVEMLAEMGMSQERAEQVGHILQANQASLQDQLRRFAGQQIAENMSRKPPDDRLDGLTHKPFSSLTKRDMERLRVEVQRLARVLRTRVALRQKRAKSGQLDAKATIRANLKHGSVPIQIKHRQRSLKPKLVVLCDISTSMRSCSELMLSLLYALQDQISKTHAFVYIDHLEYISPDFKGRDASEAVQWVLEKMPSGYYNTDFGYSLKDLTDDYADKVDRRTTLIVVGDGRNNYNDPRLDLFRRLARRSRRTIWLTPEPSIQWGTGDSDLLKYVPECDAVLQAGTLAELTTAVDKMLAGA
jgi:uncharacterized protein with von Willebrand factor type A (vWA) domain